MSKRAQFRRHLSGTTWAILPEALEAMLEWAQPQSALTRADVLAKLSAKVGASRASAEGGVGVIPVYGALAPRKDIMMELFGGASCSQIGAWLDQLNADDSVSHIVMDFDSPGGESGGIEELAAKIRRSPKPVAASVNGYCASAAYWLASQSTEIIASPSSFAGNIGVFTVHMDLSQAMADKGIKATVIKAGKYKAEDLPFGPLSEEAIAAKQTIVNDHYNAFTKDVARARGVSVAAVRGGYGEGRILTSRQALEAGVIDRIAAFDEVLAKPISRAGRSRMAAEVEALPLVAVSDQIVAGEAAIGLGDVLKALNGSSVEPVVVAGQGPSHEGRGLSVVAGTDDRQGTRAPAPKAKELTMPDNGTEAQSGGADQKAEYARRDALDALAVREDAIVTAKMLAEWKSKGTTIEAANAEVMAKYKAANQAAPVISTSVSERIAQSGVGHASEQDTTKRGFKSHREFLNAALANAEATNRDQVSDPRLKALAIVDDGKGTKNGAGLAFAMPLGFTPDSIKAAAGSDEHGVYSDTYGGFSVVGQRLAPRPLLGFEGDPTAGRTESIPMNAPVVEMEAATDKDHTSSVAAGLTVSRRAETVAMTGTRQAREMITLKATSLYGAAFATEELLADSPDSFVARISNGFDMAFAAKALDEKLRGVGGSEFLGILSALSSASRGPTISIAKETNQAADTFLANNVLKMRARCYGYGNAIWIANHDCFVQLATMQIATGVGGQLVYQQSVVEDRPDTLLGRPIFYSEFANTVGDQGDLILGNWTHYMEGIYQPLQSAESIHVRFLNHERAFKFWLRNAGMPTWRVPLTPNKSSQTLSPFVVLDAR